jgi:hypothetical protein
VHDINRKPSKTASAQPDTAAKPPPAGTSARLILGALVLAVLSVITGVISYEHGLAVVQMVGNHGLVAYLLPLVPDLMITSSSLTLLEASARSVPRPPMAVAALVAGIGWTVAMNVAAGAAGGPGGALIAAGVPLAFVLTFESLLWMFRIGRAAATPQPGAAGHQCLHEVADTPEKVAVLVHEHARDCTGKPLSQRALAAITVPSRSKLADLVTPTPTSAAAHPNGMALNGGPQ